MIKNITLENFFSFGNRQIIELNAGVNVLVGINGSGKSNFIRALELLHEGVSGKGFEDIFQRKWSGFDGIKNLSHRNTETIHLDFKIRNSAIQSEIELTNNKSLVFSENPLSYKLEVSKSGHKSYTIEEELKYARTKLDTKEKYFFQFNDKKREIYLANSSGEDKLIYPNDTLNPNELVLNQIKDPSRFVTISCLQRLIKSISLYSNFDTTFNSPIRNLSSYQSETKLRPDGSNLVSLLQKIKNNHTLEFEKIEEAFAQINPHFKSIDFDYLGSKFQLVIREKNLSKTITAEHISDGTLRFLLLLSILYNPERGNLICLDEPETGLHPDMIRTIAKAIKYAANQGTQVILATHSPLLLNHFEIDDVLIFEKNEHNETVVSTKDEEDFADWNDSYTTGKLWIDGKLGGVRW